ncbi:MAG: hypothetical protein ACK4IT_11015, partial [Thioalkalivibrionaceae bacterium]
LTCCSYCKIPVSRLFSLVAFQSSPHKHAFSSMGAALNRDLPPYCLAQGNYARLLGINKVGLGLKGFDEVTIQQLHRVFMDVVRSPARRVEKIRAWQSSGEVSEAVQRLLKFVSESRRGVLHATRNDT